MSLLVMGGWLIALFTVWWRAVGRETAKWRANFLAMQLRTQPGKVLWDDVRSFLAREENEDVMRLVFVKLRLLRIVQMIFTCLLLAQMGGVILSKEAQDFAQASVDVLVAQSPEDAEVPHAVVALCGAFAMFIVVAMWLGVYTSGMSADEERLKVKDRRKTSRSGA